MVVSPSRTRDRSSANPISYIHHTAVQAIHAGISVVPVEADGSKRPALSRWQTYQRRFPSHMELERWFRKTTFGLGLITGAISGNLEALDFDDRATFEAWLARIQQYPEAAALFDRIAWGYEESTPAGGRHLLYRCSDIAGNQKLAVRPAPEQKMKTLIETRGEGGFIIIAPSRGTVHPSGKPYMLRRGSVTKIQTITGEERSLLFALARSFDEMPPLPPHQALPPQRENTNARGSRPGDIFNQRASWQEVLEPHGWELVRVVGEEGQWRKPGKVGPGISATTNFDGSDLLYVFSTSTCFEPQQGYTKFRAYALLNHGEDFSAAARELAEKGYTSASNQAER